MSRLILLTLCLVLAVSACKKKTEDPLVENPCTKSENARCTYVSIDTSMNGFFFLPGSYWVYKNDTLNALDSVVITSVSTGCEVNAWYQNTCVRADYYQMNFYSSYNKTFGYDIIERNSLMRNWHPEYVDWWKGWGLFITPAEMIDSMQVGNIMFYDLLKSTSTGQGDPPNIKAWTAKDLGIVKKVYPSGDGRVWNLVRWKIYR